MRSARVTENRRVGETVRTLITLDSSAVAVGERSRDFIEFCCRVCQSAGLLVTNFNENPTRREAARRPRLYFISLIDHIATAVFCDDLDCEISSLG